MRNKLNARFKGIGALRGVRLSRWRFWNTGSKIGVLKFSVPNDKEAVVKQATDMWIDGLMHRVKIRRATWYPVHLDRVLTAVIVDAKHRGVGKHDYWENWNGE